MDHRWVFFSYTQFAPDINHWANQLNYKNFLISNLDFMLTHQSEKRSYGLMQNLARIWGEEWQYWVFFSSIYWFQLKFWRDTFQIRSFINWNHFFRLVIKWYQRSSSWFRNWSKYRHSEIILLPFGWGWI